MLNQGLEQFAGKRVLLLQGPVGPFFTRLAKDLRQAGAQQVFKVNFNAGDWFFYPRGAFNYRGSMEDWPSWFGALVERLRIDVVFLFGDCRPIHSVAHKIAVEKGLDIGVFEEGYVRPDYITLERFGVNGYSQLPRVPDYYLDKADHSAQITKTQAVKNAYWAMAGCSFWYFLMGALGRPWFSNYRHHRPLVIEVLPWLRSAWRKQWYRWVERNAQDELIKRWSQHYFLVPLQVFNDTQLTRHADFEGVDHFIESVVASFVQNAPPDTLLVFKHHPMDRGYKNYAGLIKRLAREAGIADRVRYIHDQHLPSLLDHARGVVVVNSTVGLSALHHRTPTKVCGNALYDIRGLTYQGALDEFWTAAPGAKPDPALYQCFRRHLITQTQLNGSFYRPLDLPGSHTGLRWAVTTKPAYDAQVPVCPAEVVYGTQASVRAVGGVKPAETFQGSFKAL